jgi:hypothetical protein
MRTIKATAKPTLKRVKRKDARMAGRKQAARREEPIARGPEDHPNFEPDDPVDLSQVIVDVDDVRIPKSDLAKAIAANAKGQDAVESIKAKRSGPGVVHDLNPYDLFLKRGWNMRNFATPKRRRRIAGLARSIASVGVRETMLAHIDGDKIVIHSGWSRLLATFHAIEVYGAEIRGVPVRFGRAGENDTDWVLSQVVNNDQDPLLPFEQGEVYKQLVAFGWETPDIAAKVGKSVTNVGALLGLQELPNAIQKLVEGGTVSAYMANKLYREAEESSDKAMELLNRAITNAALEGSVRVMPKHVLSIEERSKVGRRGGGGRTTRKSAPPIEAEPIETIPRLVAILRNATVEKDEDNNIVIMSFSSSDYNDLVVLAELPDLDDDIEPPVAEASEGDDVAEDEAAEIHVAVAEATSSEQVEPE